MKSYQAFIALLILVAPGCSKKSEHSLVLIQPEQSGFVAQFLMLEFGNQISTGEPLVFNPSCEQYVYGDESHLVSPVELIKQAKAQSPRLLQASRDFWNKNLVSNPFEPSGGIPFQHFILPSSKPALAPMLEIKEDESLSWEEIQHLYPKAVGVITLSRPGFSSDGTLAVIYMGRSWGYLAGSGRMHVLEKVEGIWVESKLQLPGGWIS